MPAPCYDDYTDDMTECETDTGADAASHHGLSQNRSVVAASSSRQAAHHVVSTCTSSTPVVVLAQYSSRCTTSAPSALVLAPFRWFWAVLGHSAALLVVPLLVLVLYLNRALFRVVFSLKLLPKTSAVLQKAPVLMTPGLVLVWCRDD